MKILKMPPYYEPEQVASSHLTKDLEESCINDGFDIEIITPTPSRGVTKDIQKKYRVIKYEKKYGGKIKIHRFAMFGEGKNPAWRAVRYIACQIIQYIKGIKVKNVDVITGGSTPPTQGVLCSLVKKKLKVPFIYILQDIFPESLVSTGLSRRYSLFWKIGRVIEDITYKNADIIIVISEQFKNNIMAKGVPEDKIRLIYNWVDENKIVPIKRDDNFLFDKYNLDREKFYITYCGNIGHTQNFELLVDVAKDLNEYEKIHFVLIGEGAYKEKLERSLGKNKINNITLLPLQPYEYIAHVFSLGDVGLIISKPHVGTNSVPSKTWSILSAERPVLASFDVESELGSIIKSSDCGIIVPPDSKRALMDAILRIYNDKFLFMEKGKKGRQYILNNLTRSYGTKQYIRVINEVLRKTGRKGT